MRESHHINRKVHAFPNSAVEHRLLFGHIQRLRRGGSIAVIVEIIAVHTT